MQVRQTQGAHTVHIDIGYYEPGSKVHGTVMLSCPTPVFVEGLDVVVLASVSACKSARVESHDCTIWSVATRSVLKEPAFGWHDCVPGLHPPAYKHQAQRKLCHAGMKLLPAEDLLAPILDVIRFLAGKHTCPVSWKLTRCEAESEPLPGTFAGQAAK